MKGKAPVQTEPSQQLPAASTHFGPLAERGWQEPAGKSPREVQREARPAGSGAVDNTPSVLSRHSVSVPRPETPFGSINNSPRLVAQRQPMVQFLGRAPVLRVQRQINIGEEITPLDGHRRRATVKEFLEMYGIHYYYSYEAVEEEVESDKVFRGAAGARELAALLGARMDVVDVNADEVQKNIQRKLVEIAELFRQVAIGGVESPAEKRDREKWYGDFILNGLCLGFVKIFEAHPDWMMGMWQTLENWRPLHGAAVGAIIDDLNEHIEAYMGFNDGNERYNILEPVLLAQEAWNNMKDQEEEEDDDEEEDGEDQGYQDAPTWVDALRGSASLHNSVGVEADRVWNVAEVAADQRWNRVRDYIIEKTAGSFGWFHVIVYHSGHEMAVRYYHSDGGQDRWYAVETVGTGMVRCNSWAEVGMIINPRLAQAVGTFGAEVKAQTPL